MALLIVLFMILAVAGISLGILYRSDMAAAGGHNHTLRTRSDYIAWAGLEYARALILTDEENPNALYDSQIPAALDGDEHFSFVLESISGPTKTDPNYWRYGIACEVFYVNSPLTRPFSRLNATVVYDPNSQTAWFTDIYRPIDNP